MKKEKLKQYFLFVLPYLIFLGVTWFTLIPQIKAGATIIGSDTRFHFGRFYDAAMQIKTGIFSLFQTNFGFQQSGRVINAVYGPIFAYLNGILVLLAGSWMKYQIISDFLITFIGASSMLHLLNYLKVNKVIGTFISIIYVNIGMIPTYINGTAFNGWGQALMPWVLLCGIRMITNQIKPINWLQLMLVMSILGQIHFLSTIFAAALLIPFFVIALFKNKSKNLWVPLIKAVSGTLILTANIWGALLVLKSNNNIAMTSPFDLRLSQSTLVGYQQQSNLFWGSVNNNILPILFALVGVEVIFVIFKFKENIVITTSTILGVVWLLVTSIYFPWGALQTRFLFLQRLLQFPYRLVVIAYPLILVSGALIIQYFWNSKKLGIISIIALIALSLEAVVPSYLNNRYFVAQYAQDSATQKYAKDSDINAFIDGHIYGKMPDYLPITDKKNQNNPKMGLIYRARVEKKYKKYQHTVLKDGTLKITWQGKSTQQRQVPVILYSQSQVFYNGKKFTGKKNEIGMPIVKQKKGKNVMSVKFITPLWFKIVCVLCALGWLTVIGYCIYRLRSKRV